MTLILDGSKWHRGTQDVRLNIVVKVRCRYNIDVRSEYLLEFALQARYAKQAHRLIEVDE